MSRHGSRTTAATVAGAVLTIGAIVAALLNATGVAIAAMALLIGIGVALSIETSTRMHALSKEVRTASGRVTKVQGLVADLPRDNAKQRAQLMRDIKNDLRFQTHQIEALLQVLPRLGDHPLLPPSGGFAMDARALGELSDVLIARAPKLVVEFGSGTSTVWAAHQVARSGGRVVSMDHNSFYAEATRAELRRHGLQDTAEVRVAPLVEREGETAWYDEAVFSDLANIDVLIVDGPPAATGKHARLPALGAVRAALSPGAIIVLDDIARDDEQEILAEWISRWPEFERTDTGTSSIAVLAERTPR